MNGKNKTKQKYMYFESGNKKRTECIAELHKYPRIFKNLREVLKEAQAVDKCFLYLSSVLKNSQVLI